jgi:hypothetical protein
VPFDVDCPEGVFPGFLLLNMGVVLAPAEHDRGATLALEQCNIPQTEKSEIH